MIIYDFYNLINGGYVGTAMGNSIETINYDYLNKNTFKLPIDYIVDNKHIDIFNDCIVDIRSEQALKTEYIFTGVCTKNEDMNLNVQTIVDYIDCKFVVSEYAFTNVTVENVIKKIITDKFVNNIDGYKNISINVLTNSSTLGSLYFEDDIFTYTLKELIIDVFKQYNIIVTSQYNYDTKLLDVTIGKQDYGNNVIDFKTFEAIDFSYTDISQSTNKINLYEKITDQESGLSSYNKLDTYYLLEDGTHTTNPDAVGRFSNVVEETDTCEPDKIEEYLAKNLVNNLYNSEVTFRVREGSEIYPDEMFVIGAKVQLYTNQFGKIDTVISEIVKEKGTGYKTIKCGTNQFDLVTLLKQKKIF